MIDTTADVKVMLRGYKVEGEVWIFSNFTFREVQLKRPMQGLETRLEEIPCKDYRTARCWFYEWWLLFRYPDADLTLHAISPWLLIQVMKAQPR